MHPFPFHTALSVEIKPMRMKGCGILPVAQSCTLASIQKSAKPQTFTVLLEQGKTLQRSQHVYRLPPQVSEASLRVGPTGGSAQGGKSRGAGGLSSGLGRGPPRTSGTKTTPAKASASPGKTPYFNLPAVFLGTRPACSPLKP